MVKRRLVRVFSFIVILALIFAMSSAPAYAISKQQFGAWIASALTAANIVVSSYVAPMAEVVYYLSDPYDVTYQIGESQVEEYMNRSTISIDKDKVNIDGTWYSDVWLSHDAAEAFRINAMDAKTAWAIASESSGTFAQGVGYLSGNPVFQMSDGNYRTQSMNAADSNAVGTHTYGGLTQTIQPYSSSQGIPSYSVSGGGSRTFGRQKYPINGYLWATPSSSSLNWYVNSNGANLGISVGSSFTNSPFTFDWVSGSMEPDEPLPVDTGLRIRVPTTVINQWYVDYPGTEDNVTYNYNDPELTQKIDDLIDLIVPVIPVVDIDFTTYDEPIPQPEPEPLPDPVPYPDPAPQPGTTIQDTDWTDLFDGIKNVFENVSINNSYIESIKNLGDKIKWGIDDLIEHVTELPDTILQDIEQGPLKIFDKLLDLFKSLFLPFFLPLKIALSIWSYVVSWIDKIFGLWNTFYAILPRDIFTPVFGTFAAFVCISIFKKVIH